MAPDEVEYVPTFQEDVVDAATWALVYACFAVVVAVTFGFVGYLASLGSLLPLAFIAALFWCCRYGEVPTHTIYPTENEGE